MAPVALSRQLVRQIMQAYEIFLLDCDGVVWCGKHAVPGVPAAVALLKARGKRVILVTNNSTKSPIDYVNKCKELGVNVTDEKDVVTSSRVTSCYVKSKVLSQGGSAYMIGGTGLDKELTIANVPHTGYGRDHVEDYPHDEQMVRVNLEKDVKAVVVGFDREVSYAKLVKAVSYLKNKECAFIATNDDAFFPSGDPDIVLPGAGSIVHSIAYCSQRSPIIVGKPHTPTFEYLVNNLKIDPKKALMVGDWPPTDIRFAKRHGITSLLVLSGNATMDHVLYPADDEATPDYYCNSLHTFCEFSEANCYP